MKYWTEEKINSAKYRQLVKEKRKIIADIYWALKKDFHQMELQDIYYDVGLMVGHCYVLINQTYPIRFILNLWGPNEILPRTKVPYISY